MSDATQAVKLTQRELYMLKYLVKTAHADARTPELDRHYRNLGGKIMGAIEKLEAAPIE